MNTQPTSAAIFEKEYDGESIADLSRDIYEAFKSEFNENIKAIPTAEDGFMAGTFKVKITWESGR